MRRLTGVLLLGALGLSATAMSQGPDRDSRLTDRLSGKLRDAVVSIVDSAKRANLPTEPLIDKALEGLTKNASEATIVAAVNRMAQDLAKARRALGPTFSPDDVKAAAVAIKAGVDIKQIERMRAARSGQRIATAINVLNHLGALRVDPDTAANVIVNLVLAAASDEQLLELKDEIERDLAAGTPAASAMSVRGQELAQLIAAGGNNGGLPGSTLPSGLGSTRAGDPGANAALGGGAAGNATPGGSKPAPAGKKGTPPRKP